MPRTVTLTFDDGGQHVYNNVPDNVTPDLIEQRAASEFSGKRLTGIDGGKSAAPVSRVNEIPNNYAPPSAPAPAPGILDRIKGAGEAALAVGTSIPAAVAGAYGGILSQATGGEKADPYFRGFMERNTYQPRTDEGQRQLRAVGEAVAPLAAFPAAGTGPGAVLAGPAMRQAAGPVASAIANSPEAALVKQGAGAAMRAVTPTVRPEVARLAAKAQALDIPLRPDMLTDNRFARMMGEALEKVPMSGSKDDMRQIAFNRALGSEIGADRNAKRITSDVFDHAMTQSGEKIGEIAEKTPIPMDPEFSAALTAKSIQSNRFDVSDVAKIVNSYITELKDKAAADGVIPGKTFRKINSDIGRQMRGTSNGDLKYALSELQDDLHDTLIRNITDPNDLGALTTARRQYAIGKTIEPLVAKSTSGDISPAGIMAAATSTKDKKSMMARGGGDFGDLARIGQLFLKEPRSSGTAERTLSYGLLGGGAAVEPHVAGGVFGAANIYNRAGPALSKAILAHQPDEFSGLAALLRDSR